MIVRRIRWFEPASDDASAPIDWRLPATITATLFLNFSFYQNHGLAFCAFGSLPVDEAVAAVGALLITALFFIGPALATHTERCQIFEVIENSLGSIPGFAVRAISAGFLSLWIADMIDVPTLWAASLITERTISPMTKAFIAAGLLSFLFFTGLRRIRTTAKLALFTDKLGVAILVAALIRARDGWSAVPGGFASAGQYPAALQFYEALSNVGYYAAPLGLFAADLAARVYNRRQASISVVTGVALPLFLALSFTGIIGIATVSSPLYQPSLNPTIAMALWSHVAGSATPGRMLIAGVSTFGAIRFGVRALATCASLICSRRMKWLLLMSLVAAIALLSLRPYAPPRMALFEGCAKCLAVVGAVLTADVVSRRNGPRVKRGVDYVGCLALLAGLATAFGLPRDFVWNQGRWWLPPLVPSYAVGFLVCLFGRMVARRSPGVVS